jgi:exopolyphosphatase/guanosine-5'-triphosphate,3'-diphosphate pyrophosphatase
VFATAAVRSAQNRNEFLEYMREHYDIEVDVVSGEEEAKLGMYGVLAAFPERRKGFCTGIIDVGGASTELTLQTEGKIFYTHSVNIGTVRLYDMAGRNREKLKEIIAEAVKEYGQPLKDFSGNVTLYGIGGTATTIASTMQQLPVYLPEKVNGFCFTESCLSALSEKLIQMSVEDIRNLPGMEPKRADLIAGGALLLDGVLRYLGVENLTVSESDNIEGYILSKEGR